MGNAAEVAESLNGIVQEMEFEIDEETLDVMSYILRRITNVNSPNVSM